MGPLKRKVDHHLEWDRHEEDNEHLDQSSFFKDRVYFLSFIMEDFLEQEDISENCHLIQEIIWRIN